MKAIQYIEQHHSNEVDVGKIMKPYALWPRFVKLATHISVYFLGQQSSDGHH